MAIQLWGIGTPRTLRPLWVAQELGIDYTLERIAARTGETRTEQYTALNRKQKIPFLVHGAVRLSESLAMSRYLIEAFAGGVFFRPESLAARARLDEWCCYLYGELDETALYVMRRHLQLPDVYGEAPAAVASCREYLARQFAVISDALAGESVMPEGFSLADVLLVSCLDWADFYRVPVPHSLKSYRAVIRRRPAYVRAMRENYEAGLLGRIGIGGE